MPDPMRILEAVAAAAIMAAVVVLVCAWPWRTPHRTRAAVGGALGVGLGFFAGCWLLGLRPHWPPREDQDRLLLLLLPTLMVAEVVAAIPGRSRWLGWLLRLAVVAGAARVLLHDTSYLAEQAGPRTREWTPAQAGVILGGLAAALAGVWAALALLARKAPGRSVALTVAVACAGAAGTVMLSGYASGGQMGLPLAAALVGALAASLALRGRPEGGGVLGLGVVGLFALLVMGRFFGELAPANAALLFFAPLLGWLPELPYLRRLGPRLRGPTRVGLAVVPVIVALVLAQEKFVRESRATSPGSQEPSIEDYMDFGK